MDTFSEVIEKETLLVVDDTPDNLMLISGLLKHLYRIKVANSGEKALAYLDEHEVPDLILLDIMMPGLSGYEVLAHLKAKEKTRDIPVIFLTAMTAMEDEKRGLEMGAVDYITKPISPPIVLARIKTQLQNKAAADFLKDQNEYLEKEVEKRTREISAIQYVTILALTSLAETRDSDTGNHIRRTQNYMKVLAKTLQVHSRFATVLSDTMIETLYKLAPLHDIGKVGVPDAILLKPGKLSFNEFEIMKMHTTLGREAIEHAEEQLGMEVDFLTIAKEISSTHHEKWDGSGYPEGLKGDAIPISGRLMAVADVYDALVSRRVYKAGMPHEKAVAIILEGRGSSFDPDVVDAFIQVQEEFRAIALMYVDTDMDMDKKVKQMELFRQG